ncbi:hypothetical protein D3C80_691800 [compost metagenome]
MITFVLFFFGKLLLMTICNHVKFTANDWFYLIIKFPGFCNKLKHTEHITVISNSKSAHAIISRFFIELRNIGSSIEQRKLSMYV